MHLFSERCKLSCRGLWNENPMIWPDLWCACLIMPGGPHIVYKVNVFAVQMHCLHDEEEVHPPHILSAPPQSPPTVMKSAMSMNPARWPRTEGRRCGAHISAPFGLGLVKASREGRFFLSREKIRLT